MAAKRGGSYFVGLGRKGAGSERRFTLAHELAHVLLDGIDREMFGLDKKTEEALCELFARRALAPPAKVQRYLDQVGHPTELADVDMFAAYFRLSIRASLVVLNEVFLRPRPVAFVAASWREHPRGDSVLGMRIDGSAADRRFFLPIDCRLSTLGYRALEAWSLDGEVGTEGSGRDGGLRLKSWQAGVSQWVGDGSWTARRHLAPGRSADADERGVLCRIDVSGLAPQLSRRRRRGRAGHRLVPVAEIPGQLGL